MTGLEIGSYSDSEAPDAPERCRINELGTSRGSSICVAARTGEADILARVMVTGDLFSSANYLFGSVVVSSTDLLALSCRKADKKKKKCQQLMLLQYLQRAPSRTRYGMFEWAMLSLNTSQITELAGYIAQRRPEPERAPYVQSIEKKLAVGEGQTPLSEDIERRREVFSVVFEDVKGLGDGTERGATQNFHNPDAHSLLTLSL